MNFKMKVEYEALLKLGIPESMALMIVYNKHNNKDDTDSIIDMVKQEQEAIEEAIKDFVPFSALQLQRTDKLNP